MFPEHQLLPISALQHLLFCERQCALIHVEQVWAENFLTIQGQHLHKKAHDGPAETRHGVRVVRGLPLRSLELGLVGKADVVEIRTAEESSPSPSLERRGMEPASPTDGKRPFPPDGKENIPRATHPLASSRSGASLAGGLDLPSPQPSPTSGRGSIRVTPIEYKRGRPKRDDSDRVQLCAQALCLEEMLGVTVTAGEIFYGQKRRRTHVEFDKQLRELTLTTTRRLHELIASRRTPLARFEPKCTRCSLIDLCMPAVTGLQRSASRVVDRHLAASLTDTGPQTDNFDLSEKS